MQLLVQVVVHEAKCNRMMLAECYLARLRYEKVIIFAGSRLEGSPILEAQRNHKKKQEK